MKLIFTIGALFAPMAQSAVQTLRDAASGTGIFMGSCMKNYNLAHDQDYADLGSQQYDLVTACNGCKMNPVAKDWDTFNYTGCDYIRDYAKQNKIAMRGHVLLWASTSSYNNPKFIQDNKDPSKLEPFLEKYIKQTVTRFKDTIFAWDVVNEAITDGQSTTQSVLKNTVWSRNVPDFMCKVFKWAHEADPNAELYYNDYNHISSFGWYKTKSDKIFKFLKNMTESGCPVHGVGFQAHIDLNFNDNHVKSFIANMKRYDEIGLKVHLTELTVKCNVMSDDKTQCKDDPQSDADLWAQSEIYRKLIDACLTAPNCMNFETWGFTERYEWTKAPQGVVFDKDLQKKYSYYSLLNSLKAFDRDSDVAKAKVKAQNKVLSLYPTNVTTSAEMDTPGPTDNQEFFQD